MKTLGILLLALVGAHARSLGDNQVGHHGARAAKHCTAADETAALEVAKDIADLTAGIVGISKRLEEGVGQAKRVDDTLQSLSVHVDALEGSGCDKSEIQCGGDFPTCVGRNLVCDGKQDCPNGLDESQCDVGPATGSVWTAEVIYDTCSKRKPETFTITVNKYTVPDYFKPFPVIDASFDIEFGDGKENHQHANFVLEGFFDLAPGDHKAIFPPLENDGIVFTCTFDGIEQDHCHGRLEFEQTGEECAAFYVYRSDV